MSGRGGVGREQRVGGGEEGVRELYAVVVNSMSEGEKNDGWWEGDEEKGEEENALSSLMSLWTKPTPCIHPTALASSHHILWRMVSPGSKWYLIQGIWG